MNRKERRNLKKEINIFSDVINILKQYFPKLINKFEKIWGFLYGLNRKSTINEKIYSLFVTR